MAERQNILGLFRENVFILDGAMGTSIQTLRLGQEESGGKASCNEYLNLTNPDVIKHIHKSFLEVGCMGVETNSFGGSRIKLDEYGLGDKVREINKRAAEIAREAVSGYKPEKLVFGSIGPTGMLPSSEDPDLGRVGFDELARVFEEQASALLEGGVDVFIIETVQDILEAKAAVTGCREAAKTAHRRVPIIAQVTLDASGRMLLGTDVGSALVTLEGMGVDGFGINCSTGPDKMRDSIRFLSAHCPLPISCLPNMGIPREVDGAALFPLDAEAYAEAMEELVREFGVALIGGCCGSTPAHLGALVNRVRSLELPDRTFSSLHAVSSAMTYVALKQEPPPLIVGERVNAQGSRKMKQLLLKDDLDGIVTIARSQIENGAHALDVCVALSEKGGEVERFLRLSKKLSLRVGAPIVIDSTDREVIAEVIKNYPGRAIINSINLENGEEKLKELGMVIKTFGAFVIALTIDEKGMAKTSSEKAAIAKRTADVLERKFQIGAERIIFDPLTFTLATGEQTYRRSAIETLNAIGKIKQEIPGCMTILGVSNVSFGLPRGARPVLNSVFLYHALQMGLDLAIVNPNDITPYREIPEDERSLTEDLIFDRQENALSLIIARYEGKGQKRTAKEEKKFASPEAEVRFKIMNRTREGIERAIDEMLSRQDAVTVLDSVLLPAMKEVGDRFAKGELILPFVLQSAEVMKAAVNHLEKYLKKKEGYTRGKILLATVYGDVHDIGKNLVKTILSNNGFEVRDLGKQVPAQTIIEEARSFPADAVGLSALLVSTAKQMTIVVQELHRAGIHVPVIIGGAAVTRNFAKRSALVEGGGEYPAGLFYAKDAFEGLKIMEKLSNPKTRDAVVEQYRREVLGDLARGATSSGWYQRRREPAARAVAPVAPPEPPFWGLRTIRDLDLEEVFSCMDLVSLYRLSWGIRRMEKNEYERIIRERFEPLLRKMRDEAREKGYLQPGAVYGYFPCRSRGDTLIIYHPEDREKVLAKMHFPRQRGKKRLSIADYFRSDITDVIAMQIVTVGKKASEVCESLQESGEYAKSYFLHGLSVEAAEGLAEYVHRKIRKELSLSENRGKRYSHGYSPCPDLSENKTMLDLLEGKKRLGITLTPAFQFVPEQTTASLVVHHPEASYFGA